MSLLDEVLEAHGGAARWNAARSVQARVRSGGFLVRTRMPGNRFADYTLTIEVAEPHAVMDPFPRPGERAVFDQGEARIERDDGEVIASRPDPRPEFSGLSGLRRNLRTEHAEAGGLVFPTRRWVPPIGPRNRPLPFPTLVWLELSEPRVDSERA
jgi:hypothetical protein